MSFFQETLNGVFDMPGIVPGPSWSSRARRRGRGAATAAARPTPPPRRGQQRQRRGTAAKGTRLRFSHYVLKFRLQAPLLKRLKNVTNENRYGLLSQGFFFGI